MVTNSLVHTQKRPPPITPGHGTAVLGPGDLTDIGDTASSSTE